MRVDVAPDGLRRIQLEELAVGAPLPGNLRDRRGQVLIPAGQVLGQDDIVLLKETVDLEVYAGDDWPQELQKMVGNPAVPAEVLKLLRLRRASRGHDNPRRHGRRACTIRLHMVIEERGPQGCRRREVEVTMCDISISGLAFIFPQYVHPGSVIHATFRGLPGKPRLVAVVRNCVYLSAREHRVGTEFVERPPA